MRGKRMKRIGRIGVFAVAVIVLAALLATLDASRTTVDAASLKHIDEIVAQSGAFNILEIVPDVNAASIGYTIDGQEPAAAWKTAAGALTSPSARSQYVNNMFTRLASKGVLGSGTTTPLKYTYYDSTNHSYYTESYLVPDPSGWQKLYLSSPESVTLTGTMTPASDGPFRANYTYAPADSGGYVQRIWYFMYTTAPNYGHGTYYYSPVFTAFTPGEDLTGKENYAVYTQDPSGNYIVDPGKITVGAYMSSGGFDSAQTYYYVDPTQTGAPGNYGYAAVIDLMSDNDDTPGDGFMTAPSGTSYFSRSVTSYNYVETGGNNAYSASGSGTYTVSFPSVYYHAGYSNNNLFKTQVFGLDSTNMSALNVTVTVRRADQVTEADVTAAGLIYLSAGTDATQSGVTLTYNASNDIPDTQAVAIYKQAADQIPVIVDYPIAQGLTQTTSSSARNMQKLSLLCLQSSLSLPVTSLSALTPGDWGTIWSNLSYVSSASESDKTYVSNNVYCFNSFHTDSLTSTSQATLVSALASAHWSDAFSQNVYSNGFSTVLTEIQNENFLRTIAGQQDLLPENVTVANSIRHIINFKDRRDTSQKTAIKVLDLEPAKVTSTGLTPETVQGWINNTVPAAQISVVHMTTGEFVGKIEDINETYDMIYIGMSTESLNAPGGTTAYNDTSMNGLIYSNIGDKYYTTIEMAGIRAQDYLMVGGTKAINNANGTNANLFRFSGNDITKTAVTELQKYVQAGYPLILADGFVSGTGINTAKVDNSSYMYEAVSAVYGARPNVMTQTYAAANDATVIKYLNVSKPQVGFILDGNKKQIKPPEYAENSSSVLAAANPDDETNWAHDKGFLTAGCYYLYYGFSISNATDPTPTSTTYDCRLYIDLNADGRYSGSEELKDIEIHQMVRDDTGGALKDGPLVLPLSDENGQYYALSADVPYEVTRQMPKDYVGIIPWKLEVIKKGADQIHASQTGFTRINGVANKESINILQIMQPGTETSKLNLHTQINDPQGIYGKLIRGLQDFSVNIDEIAADKLGTVGETPDAILDWLENKGLTGSKGYEMLIIGFNDCYDGIGEKAAPAIVSYINSGRSVLFTHDTTSLTQVPSANFPMAINGTAPNIKTLLQTDIVYNTSASVYRSINGNVSWYGASSTASPPNIRQYNPTYIVFMSSNVTSSNESDYYAARVSNNIYKVTSYGYNAIANPTSYDNFKSITGNAPVIYVRCTAASGWYGTGGYANTCDITTTNNFTKFVDKTKYTCSSMTYRYTQGTKNNWNYSSMSTTSYAQIMMDIYNVNPNTYTVVGTYDAATNTYTISGKKYYPATGASFPQSTLYDRDPANQYTLSTLPNNIKDWGYYFNTVIRDAVGLDRYGVTSILPVNNNTATLGSLVNVTAPMSFDDIPTVLLNNRSVAYAPKSGRSSTVNEYQGYTNYALIRFAGSGNTYRYTNNAYTNRETTNISQVNKGQITSYPFDVNTASFGGTVSTITGYGGSYMKIGNTHEQYFQINMNTDDIVVWYCLSNYSSYNPSTGIVSYDDSSYYDDVPNDCVNAYYIYNKGNVTYSGVGHTSDAGLYTDTGAGIGQQYINEAKLFVNTMIAAYRSGKQPMTVSIKKDALGTSNLSQKIMTVDEGNPDDPSDNAVLEADKKFDPTGETRAVYFRLTEPDASKDITVQYYVSTDGGQTRIPLTTGDDGKPIVTYIAGKTQDKDVALQPGETLNNGYVYKFYLPDASCLDILKKPDIYYITVSVEVTKWVTKTDSDGNETRVAVSTASSSLDVKKRQLFQLS